MNLQEHIRKVLREETSDNILAIKNILDLTIIKEYKDFICDIGVFNIEATIDDVKYLYVVEFTFFREQEPRTLSDYDIYIQIMEEAGDLIYDYTNIDVFIQQVYVKRCGNI